VKAGAMMRRRGERAEKEGRGERQVPYLKSLRVGLLEG